MATALEHLGGVEALVLGGCCELNSTAQALITEIGTQRGHLAAANLGDGSGECVALEIRNSPAQAAGGHQNLEQLSRPCKCSDSVRQPHPRHETPAHARSNKNSRGERASSTTSGTKAHQRALYTQTGAPCHTGRIGAGRGGASSRARTWPYSFIIPPPPMPGWQVVQCTP